MANAADNFQWNTDNVFQYGNDLNPLAMQVGAGADGVRDTLAQKRDDFLQPLYQNYRNAAAQAGTRSNASDAELFGSQDFQNYVQSGQRPAAWSQSSTSSTPTSAWTQQPANPQIATDVANRVDTSNTQNTGRNNDLYNLLQQRATQSLAVDRNDPIIRAQADAYAANQERARRNYPDDVAEKSGPYANLQGEQRMAAERYGQSTGAFEAQLLGNELSARRNEIAQSLESMRGLLTTDQQIQLQRELGLLDQVIKQQNIGLQQQSIGLQQQQLGQDWQKAMLQNDQFLRQLGLNDWDRQMYYDALNRGLL